jgi:hypothetical protein
VIFGRIGCVRTLSTTSLRPLAAAVTLIVLSLCSGVAGDAFRAQKTPNEILNNAAEIGEKALSALREYSFYSEVTIETISNADIITGKYYRLSSVSFDASGNRNERVLENSSTLPKELYIGTNSSNNLIRVYQFFVTPEALQLYEFTYIGREHIDELNTYVFDVRPKVKLANPDKSPNRYLRGRVWIDDQDLCVVKVSAEASSGENGSQASHFETYYQNQDRYWFPTFSSARDTISVGRLSKPVLVTVRFTGYKRAGAK